MRRKFSFDTKVVIGSIIFALASSAFLYFIPPTPKGENKIRGPFVPNYGYAYLVMVKIPFIRMSEARLYENEKPLGPSNSDLSDVVAKGKGLYKIYRNEGGTIPLLMFSSSDNTDPNTNGRKYRLEYSEP